MAFRIHQSVVRGEIDNRVKGSVRGKIWLAGRDEPVTLELRGNAHPDLAGCLLTFANPLEPVPDPLLDCLHVAQLGTIGDLTASRKVRVFDIPLEEALAMIRRKEKPPEHIANCLYLEWFSERNGRVVIESTDYELTISAPAWTMSAEENQHRAEQAAAGLVGFMQRLTVEEINAICEEALNEPLPDPLREEIDWIRTEDGEVRHPLQHRCYQSAFRFRQNIEMLGHTLLEHPKVDEATFEFLTTAIKLAGALNGLAPGHTFFEHGLTVALLKRALGHLHRAQAGLEAVASEDLLPSPLIEEARQEMFAIREDIIRLMDRLRGRR